MKFRFLICTVLLALFAVPAFADSLSFVFTNQGGNLSASSSGISAGSMINSIIVDGMLIETGNLGLVQFDTGTFTGSLKNGSFTGGDFSFGDGSGAVFANNFTGTLTKIGKGLYDLVGTFSFTFDGSNLTGSTNQIFGLSHDDDGQQCFGDLHGTTTITTASVPEPGMLTLFGTGLIGLAGAVRRKLLTGRA
jgi:hypothetical protein